MLNILLIIILQESKLIHIILYLYKKPFLDKGFKFQPNVCNGCHDLLTMSMNLSDIALLNIKGSDYRCIISGISKSETINLMENADLTGKRGTL